MAHRRGDVVQQRARSAQVHHKGIHAPVGIVVGEARAAAHALGRQDLPCAGGHILELASAQILENRMLLRDQVNQSAVRDENIAQPAVVEVISARAPACILRSLLRNTGLLGDIDERQFASVAQQAVVLGIAHPEVHFSGVIGVEEHGAHGRSGFAILAERSAGFRRDLLEGAVSLVVKQEVFGLIVGDVDIGVAIAIVVARGDAHGAALECRNAGFLADVDEGALARIVKQQVAVGSVVERPRVVIGRVVSTVSRVELHIAADE